VREFTYDALLDDYELVRQGIRDLEDQYFRFLTPEERDLLRGELLEEIRTDFAFKLMALLEADIRADYRRTLVHRRRDSVSKAYRDLCMTFRRETRQVVKPARVACAGMSLDRILDQLRDCFQGVDEDFRRVCSTVKTYFSFRNWYAHGRAAPRPVVPDPDDIFAVYQEFRDRVLSR